MGLHEDYLELLENHGLKLDEDTHEQQMRETESHYASLDIYKSEDKIVQDIIAFTNSIRTQHERWKWILDMHQKNVEEMYQLAGYKIESPVLVVQFPTGTVNAQVTATPNGFLVLVNIGIMALVNTIIRILFKEIRSEGDGHKDIEASNRLLLEAVLGYLGSHDATMPPEELLKRTQVIDDDFVERRARLIAFTEEFIIAHEYAHIINGDLDNNIITHLTTPVGQVDVIKKNWESEFQADIVATYVLLEEFKRLIDIGHKGIINVNAIHKDVNVSKALLGLTRFESDLLAAPPFLFGIDFLITQVAAMLVGKTWKDEEFISEDHPPALLRAQVIDQFYAQHLSEIEKKMSYVFPSWIYERIDSIKINDLF